MVRTALSLIPEKLLNHLIILSIDDTMVEKYGEHFENRAKLFDHDFENKKWSGDMSPPSRF